jgi:hypothetical protein
VDHYAAVDRCAVADHSAAVDHSVAADRCVAVVHTWAPAPTAVVARTAAVDHSVAVDRCALVVHTWAWAPTVVAARPALVVHTARADRLAFLRGLVLLGVQCARGDSTVPGGLPDLNYLFDPTDLFDQFLLADPFAQFAPDVRLVWSHQLPESSPARV